MHTMATQDCTYDFLRNTPPSLENRSYLLRRHTTVDIPHGRPVSRRSLFTDRVYGDDIGRLLHCPSEPDLLIIR